MTSQEAAAILRPLWPQGTISISLTEHFGPEGENECTSACIALFDGLCEMLHHCMADTIESAVEQVLTEIRKEAADA